VDVVSHELYLAGLTRGLSRVTEGCIQSQRRFQGYTALTGTCFPSEEDDDALRLAPEKGPGTYTLIMTAINTIHTEHYLGIKGIAEEDRANRMV
jgi:hypothetical protein